jgi:predicted Abi (CAAX) family protease
MAAIDSPKKAYHLFQAAGWVQPDRYPISQSLDSAYYRPAAAWMGRLILKPRAERDAEHGCYFEVYHAAVPHGHLVGQTVRLRYSNDSETMSRVWAVTRNVVFNDVAHRLVEDGLILAERINHWRQVSPLESLAGAHPYDDIVVRLLGPVTVEEAPNDGGPPVLRITRDPSQITGCYVGLVTFAGPLAVGSEQFRVRHFNRVTRQFDGPEEIVSLPAIVADEDGVYRSTSAGLEHSPLNGEGWYIYGAQDGQGVFTVQSLMPRALLRRQPQQTRFGRTAAWRYLRREVWKMPVLRKGTMASVLCAHSGSDAEEALAAWRCGDKALVLHLYAGIGGKTPEAAVANSPYFGIYFGHFSFGVAEVVHEPLADELHFDITYYQIYTHTVDGLASGALDWARYMGDRQFGFLGCRPTCDILVKLDEFSDPFDVDGDTHTVLDLIEISLEQMAARYRIGDGRGGTYVAAANNCAQDSSQALFTALRRSGLLKSHKG